MPLASSVWPRFLDECGLTIPAFLEGGATQLQRTGRQLDGSPCRWRPPAGQFTRRGDALSYDTAHHDHPILTNDAASLFALEGVNLRLVEFHSKANALTDASMEIVAAAAKDHGLESSFIMTPSIFRPAWISMRFAA